MPRRFFRKFAFKRDRIHGQWFMAPFRHLLNDHRLWTIRRKNVLPSFALGLFIAFMPIPGHLLAAVLLALALRINIPVAGLSTLVVNPLTVGPVFYLCYLLGVVLLGVDQQPFDFEFSLTWLGEQFSEIGAPLLLGCLIVGSTVAIVGYVALDYFWRASIADYLAKRRAKRAEKGVGSN
jgi:uncharacterized protein (DUF2062 family)